MTAAQKRQAVVDQYKKILGRNTYSQDATKRECCFTQYKDGKYYSDCSSSVRLAYKAAGIGLNNIGGNTVAQYQNKDGVKIECAIKAGVPTDITKLRAGDILLFAGTDTSRAYADCVGHVEMIAAISGTKVTLYGHGSGTPSSKDMVSYCKNRYAGKTSTKIGNKGLLKVVRLIPDDGNGDGDKETLPTKRKLGDRLLTHGDAGDDVKELQTALKGLGYFGGAIGGNYLDLTQTAVKAFQAAEKLTADGEYGAKSHAALMERLAKPTGAVEIVLIVGGDANIRTTPSAADGDILAVARNGAELLWAGETAANGWHKVKYKDGEGWVSPKCGKRGVRR